MPHVYRHFMPQNIAPPDTKSIGVYDASGKHITSIPLGRLKPPTKAKLYSFSIVSDIYYTKYSPTGIPIQSLMTHDYFEHHSYI